jgi:hypothetical protein
MKLFSWHTFAQVGLTTFTLLGILFTSLKLPQYGLISIFISEFFWVYSSYKAWKEAGQIGIFLTTVVYTLIALFGVINYWFL